ncbi:pilus assembly protein [Marinimicrobium sp. C6131]|uniref:pilus assembly protein n=1 Tax=Marinimicrobium sp. C6131 TaxID=3022676 RepID=UPI00223D35E1|nr:pilus assembly protein [Marinimicrobium sp. C6131]UZJ45472.1 pilus assembly protein [Marinimicrobium sp. C6131]
MSSTENVNLNSLKLVQDQLVATIEQAAARLEEFAADRNNGELLQNCIDGIKQISGTLNLLQLRGVDLLAQELVEQITDIPLGEEQNTNRKLDVLTSAFFILPRYLEYCLQTSRSMAVLLIPHINELRQLRKAPPLPESYFYSLEPEPIYSGKGQSSTVLGEDLPPLVRRLRHMYQVGLVNLLQNKQQRASLGMMGRAMERLESISHGRPRAGLWWVAAAMFEALRATNMDISVGRKRLFSVLDRHIKQLQTAGREGLELAPEPALLKEMLYLIALSRANGARTDAVVKAYGLEPLPYTDAELVRELEFLKGPSAATINSMGAVLKDELRSTKNILERAAQGGTELLRESPELLETLKKVADILSVVGLISPSNSLKEEIQKIQRWQKSDETIDPEELLAVADTLLYIESSVSGLGKMNLSDERLAKLNATSRDEIIANSQLAEAEELVLEEAESGLAMIKRALTSYAESNYDVGHIKNVATTLNTIRGGMILLNRPRSAAVLHSCSQFIEESLLKSEQPAAVRHMLENFADAIISLEYYIDSLRQDRNTDDSVLQVAEESLAALGYPVS